MIIASHAPPRRIGGRRWAGALAMAGLAVGLEAAVWRVGVHQLDHAVDGWMDQARQRGWTVSSRARQRGGWPVAATLMLEDVSIAGGGELFPGGVAWSTPHLLLRVSLAHPMTLTIEAAGQQHLRLSHAPEVVFAASALSARLSLAQQPSGGVLQAEALAGGVLGSGHPADVQMATLTVRLTDSGPVSAPAWQSARLEITALGIGLPDIGRWPLGGFVASAGGTVGLSSIPRGKAQQGAGSPEDQARAWRDAGGRLDLTGLNLHWGPLRLASSAVLGLDGHLQPAGSGSADLDGSFAALDALAGGGIMPSGMAATAKAVLAVMPSTPDGQGTRLHFTLSDSTLSVGRIPIIRLRDLSWQKRK